MNAIGSMVKTWLQTEGYAPQDVNNPKTEWMMQATVKAWKHFIFQPKGVDEFIAIQSSWTFNDAQLEFLRTLQARDAARFFWNIRMELLWKPTEFEMLPPKNGIPAGFRFTRQLSYDGELSRGEFMKALREVHKCETFLGWSIEREMELAQIPDTPGVHLAFEHAPPAPASSG